jgi:hypothetical protein
MVTKEQNYVAIAARMRTQRVQDTPLKHEWIELLTRLSHLEDGQLRATGILELSHCADRATRLRHV